MFVGTRAYNLWYDHELNFFEAASEGRQIKLFIDTKLGGHFVRLEEGGTTTHSSCNAHPHTSIFTNLPNKHLQVTLEASRLK